MIIETRGAADYHPQDLLYCDMQTILSSSRLRLNNQNYGVAQKKQFA